MTALVGYGSCTCGGVYEPRLVDVRMTVGDRSITLSEVAQGVCPACGSHVYSAAELESIEAVFHSHASAAGTEDGATPA
jgi:YgiT-type zinc finger domain-containing protein